MAVKRVTMQDIAAACGLSRNTVSKVFNERGSVPEGTRRLVLAKARELGYPEETVRIPILLQLDGGTSTRALELLRSGAMHTHKDFSFALDSRHFLVYKTISATEREAFSNYREMVREYLKPIQTWRKETGGKAFLYVGSFQDTYPQYYYGYRHCLLHRF